MGKHGTLSAVAAREELEGAKKSANLTATEKKGRKAFDSSL